MAIDRTRPVRRADHSLLKRRLIAVGLVAAAVLAIGLPAGRALGYELERRSLVVERAVREAQLQLLRDDLKALATPTPAAGE